MTDIRAIYSLCFVTAAPLVPLCVNAQKQEKNGMEVTYAKIYQVSDTEASYRLARMDDAGRLQQRLLQEQPETFAGMYIEHRPVFRVVVKFTKSPKEKLNLYTADRLFVAQSAPRSLELLRSVQDELGEQLLKSKIQFESGLDVKNSEINVYVLNPLIASRQLSKLMSVAGFIKLHQTTGFMELTSISGGNKVTSPGQDCTAGFNVVDSNREIGITTAGHCTNMLRYASTPSYALDFQSESDGGSFDVQWNKQPASAPPQQQLNEILVPGGPQSPLKITTTTSSSAMTLGAVVCKSGYATLYTCGTIADLNAQSMYKNVIGSYIRVHENNNALMTNLGDSGGPVFKDNSAYGIVHGRGAVGTPTRNDLYFMPIERFTAIGVNVLTKPLEFTSIPAASGPMGGTGNITLNFQGTPKFPMINTSMITYCPPGFTCTAGDITYMTNIPSPLTETFRCNAPTATPSAVFRLKSYITDASGIVTPAVEYQFTCVQQTASENNSGSRSGQKTFELVHP